MAATFLKAQGYQTGLSLVEIDKQDLARALMDAAGQKGVSLFLPVDVIVADSIIAESPGQVVEVPNIPPSKSIVDIGPRTIEIFSQQMRECQTVFWNGPMGVFEIRQFAGGTRAMAELLASLKATTVVGGGSTAEIVEEMNLANKMTHVSTGGGASLNFLEGKSLPGVTVLLDK
jgi:phosphoglycerate kinase